MSHLNQKTYLFSCRVVENGALQDFIRIFTKKPDSLKTICSALPENLLYRIYSAEDQAQRAYNWSHGARDDCDVLGALGEEYEIISRVVLQDEEFSELLSGELREKGGLREIQLAFKCQHFSRCFGLNHLIAVLIREYSKSIWNHDPFRPGSKLVNVTPAEGSHSCDRKHPEDCLGERHKAQFQKKECLPGLPAQEGSEGLEGSEGQKNEFDVIIVRHGVELPPPITNPSSVLLPRQALPYHYPWSSANDRFES